MYPNKEYVVLPFHSGRTLSTSTWDFHKPMTVSGVFILMQLNKCGVVYDSVLQRVHSGDECLSSSTLFKYESRVGQLFVSERG